MGRLTNAFNAFRSALFTNEGAASLTDTSGWLYDYFSGVASSAGVSVSPLSAMGVPTVSACINARSRALSSIPLKLYRRMPDGGKEIAYDHPLYYLLHDAPNEEMTSADFRRAIFSQSALRNSGYAMIVRDGADRVRELYPIANSEISEFRQEGTGKLMYRVNGKEIPLRKILHFRGLTFNGIVGVDMVSVARDSIGLAIALQDHAARYFPNSISPSMIFGMEGWLKPDQLPGIKAEIMKRAGLKGAHEPMILQGGTKPIEVGRGDNQKGQFVEARKAQDKAICQVFGVPQSKAGIMDDAHYDNVEQDNGSFVTDTLMPDAVQAEQEMNAKLLGPIERGKYFFQFDFNGLLRAKLIERMQAHKIAIEAGIANRNEVRVIENMNPVPGGDNFLVSQNVQMLDSKGNLVPKPVETSATTQNK